jgi:hypothetical protein
VFQIAGDKEKVRQNSTWNIKMQRVADMELWSRGGDVFFQGSSTSGLASQQNSLVVLSNPRLFRYHGNVVSNKIK